ncbi:CTI6 [Sanghuangporus sanghuang]
MAPASPKDKRRSTRRSAHSSSKSSGSSGSPSPDAAPLPPPPLSADNARSVASSSSASTSRGKRVKDDTDDTQAPPPASPHKRNNSLASTVNGANTAPPVASKRTKRKGKDAAPVDDGTDAASADAVDSRVPEPTDDGEKVEEDGGVTRCVCDGLDDDADAPDFMIQCEQCMAWQHGPCMGFAQESEIPEGNYYCEQCKPEDHVELLKKLARRQRQSSEKSVHASHKSRTSRSHSPTHFLKPAKRRNTMNSRDAAYEENLQELLDATAAEAMPDTDTPGKEGAESVAKTEEPYEEITDIIPGGRKKRKRVDDDNMPAKRKRSASVASDGHGSTVAGQDKPEATTPITTALLPPPPPPPPPAVGKSRARRGGGGRKSAVPRESPAMADGEEAIVPPTKKHPNQYTYRTKSANGQSRRAPQSNNGQNQQSTHDHGTRRNAHNASSNGPSGPGSKNNHNAYYNNVQLPMFTSWGLPDYLAHLQSILPSDVPPPLHIRGSTSFIRDDFGEATATSTATSVTVTVSAEASNGGTRGSMGPFGSEVIEMQTAQMANVLANATESVTERGVKVKWPAKRMSVSDMNKRVRALVEWVGREQALALDRDRRKIALKKAVQTHSQSIRPSSTTLTPSVVSDEPASMAIDGTALTDSPKQEQSSEPEQVHSETAQYLMNLNSSGPVTRRPSTSKMMEELMEELISFQERFGPGVKGQARERRVAVLS